MSFKFIHAADIHLDSPLKGLERYEGAPVEEIRGATRKALENLVALAMQEGVDFVVIAGDIYDGDWKDFNTGLFFVQQMLKLREAKIPVVAIHGNHDAENKMTRSLNLRDSVRFLSHRKPETVMAAKLGLPHLDVAFHGQSFATASVLENVVPTYPAAEPHCFNIGVLHTSLTGGEGHDPYAPCTPANLREKGYDYWALGHIHKSNLGELGDPPIVFPGNIQGRHIREQGAKGCVLVTVDDAGLATTEFRPLDVLRWVHVQIPAAGANHPDELLERFADKLRGEFRQHDNLPLAVRVSLVGPCAAHRLLTSDSERWTSEIRLAAAEVSGGTSWVEKVRLQTSLPRSTAEAAEAEGPLEELLQTLNDMRSDPVELQKLCEELGDLRRKLPEELNREPDWRRLDDPAQLAEYFDEIEGLLLSRLTAPQEAA